MERRTNLKLASKIMGKNFIGPDELEIIADSIGILKPSILYKKVPNIKFTESTLKKNADKYLLILGINKTQDGKQLTINKIREFFGTEPDIKEPCMYNQNWYLNERFAKNKVLGSKWYLIRKEIFDKYRGLAPNSLFKDKKLNLILPSAILCTFTFFAYYYHSEGKILWKDDFVWCSDMDHNNDKIYIGRYLDSAGINKNGFNIHRHLSITKTFSYIHSIQ